MLVDVILNNIMLHPGKKIDYTLIIFLLLIGIIILTKLYTYI